jgi:cyanate permease
VVWIPASLVLIFQGNIAAGVGLMLFCAIVVGSIDNLLRPVLVGKDTNMHELMIFFGTLGGLFTFGMSGLLIGPLIASLFLTLWELYGVAFKDMLPEVGSRSSATASPGEEDDATILANMVDVATVDGETGDQPMSETDRTPNQTVGQDDRGLG